MTSLVNLNLIQETLKNNQFYAVYGKKTQIKDLNELSELERQSLKNFNCGHAYKYINQQATKMIDQVKRRKSKGAYLCLNDEVIGIAYYKTHHMRRELRCALGFTPDQKLLELQVFGISKMAGTCLLQGKGFGSFFLQCLLDSLECNCTGSGSFYGIILHPIDDRAVSFYEKQGFIQNPYRSEMIYLLDI
ncbi:hypothetical protein AXH23_17490 [Acinetobacter pittii]|uniref:N-acetyltransferase n=1 Tax=Acinetobacter pittii TaxID=48296 RepID=A0A6G6APU8_ACIPI|nr:GNAT family N-acetyltransferase [Acinetobacter pittii]ODL99661.1 hypothetical protein AXH23_17490 [Acinetobacter pittii]QID24180.1 N-acetyltransferase [Acinetobacter pittii]